MAMGETGYNFLVKPLLLIVFGVLPLLTILLSLWRIGIYMSSSHWLETNGVIVDSQIISNSESTDSAFIKFSYTIGGRQFDSCVVRLGGTVYLTDRQAERMTQKYPVGKGVTVLYDPENPKSACLERGSNFLPYVFLILFSLIWSGVGTVIFFRQFYPHIDIFELFK